MLRLFTKFTLVLALLLYGASAYAQVKIGDNTYSNLYSAFNAINAGTYNGDIEVQITDDFTESNTAILYPSGYNNASYSSVTVYPTGEYTIKGSNSNGIIQLQGTKNVVIDGRVNREGSEIGLTIQKTTTSGAIIRIDSMVNNKAPYDNSVLYCNLIGGSKTSSYGVTFGLSSSYTSYGGGENNEVAYCTIKNVMYAIRMYGTSNGIGPRSNKVHHNVLGSENLSETIGYQTFYLYYTYNPQIYDNIIQHADYTSTIYVFYCYYCDYPEIYNNTIKNIAGPSSVYIGYIYYATYPEIYGNTIENISTTSTFYGWYVYQSTASVAYIADNTVQNITAASTSYCIYNSAGGSNYSQIINNTVKNVTSASTIYPIYSASNKYADISGNTVENIVCTGTATIYGIYMSSNPYSTIYDNVIQNCTVGGYMHSIYMTSCTQSKVHRNYINGITSNGTGASSAKGFYVLSSNNTEFVNNTVSNLMAPSYSTSYSYGSTGFLFTSGTGYKLYYNSVYLSGKKDNPNTTSGGLTAALYMSTTSINNFDIRNNTFVNTMEGNANDYNMAIYIPSASSMTNSTLNYNNYYVGTNRYIGYYSGYRTDYTAFKNAMGTAHNANSMNFDPIYNASYNLAPYYGSPLIGKGVPISGYTTDMLGNARSTSAPTVGAYEKEGDIVGPEITYEELITTTDLSSKSITAKIVDRTGVNTSSSEPRLYFRKQATDNTYNGNTSSTSGWKYSSGEQMGDEFTFYLDYDQLQGGAGVGDVIEYFIIAQDVSDNKNMSYSSGKFTQEPTSTHLTADNFPVEKADNYRLALGVSGVIEVGTGKTYTNLSNADGIFDVINKNVVNGDIIIKITSDLEDETGAVKLGRLTYEGREFSIRIEPSSKKRKLISGQSSDALIGIIGTNNITIDGSYEGEGRYLAFANFATQSTSNYRATLMVGTGGGAGYGRNITIENCEIFNGDRLTYSYGIIASDGAVSTSISTPAMDGLTIRNNWVYNSYVGIYISGASAAATVMTNLLIEDNIVGDESRSSSNLYTGIDVRYAPYAMIRGNKIMNMDGGSNNTSTIYGMYIYGYSTQPMYIDGNTITGLNYQGSSLCTVVGINLQYGYYHEVTNNLISDILTTAYLSYSPSYVYNYSAMGMRIYSYQQRIWHNTIYMTGQMKNYTTSQGYGGYATCIVFPSTSYSRHDIRGNIFHNSVLSAQTAAQAVEANIYAGYMPDAGFTTYNTFTTVDNNLYSISNGARLASTYYNSKSSPYPAMMADWTVYDLNQWRDYIGKDQNSYQVDYIPVVNSETFESDAHLDGFAIGDDSYMFNGISEVSTDVDGERRNSVTYYGADEINPTFEFVSDTKITPDNPTICVNDAATISVDPQITGFGDGIQRDVADAVSVQWYKNGERVNGANDKNFTFNPVRMADSARYYAVASFLDNSLVSSEVLFKVEEDMKFAMQPRNTDVCITNPVLHLPSQPAGTYFGMQWEFKRAGTSNWVELSGEINTSLDKIITYNEVGEYRLKLMGPGNCGPAVVYSNPASVTLSTPLSNIAIHQVDNSEGKDLSHTCFGENISLNTTIDGSVFGYLWQRDIGQGFVDLSSAQYPTATSATLLLNNSDPGESGIYRCKVFGSSVCGTAEMFTEPVDVTIWPYFELDEQPESVSLCEGDNSFIRVNITGIVYSYQWYKDGVALTAKESEYFDKPVFFINNAQYEDAGSYTCFVEAEDCFGYVNFESQAAAVYVTTDTRITKAPFTQAVFEGQTATFRVYSHVNGAPGGTKPEVQWYRGDEPLKDGGRIIGAKSDILVINNVQASDLVEQYKVVVTGNCSSAEASNFGLVPGNIIITEQPTDVDNACEDDVITLKVVADATIPGVQLEYSWFRDGIELVDGNGISGAKTPNLTIAPANRFHSGGYYAMIKPLGSVLGMTTITAEVKISDKPHVTYDLPNEVNLVTGDMLTLKVETEGMDIDYQWYFNGAPIDGEETDTYTKLDMQEEDSGEYYVVATNDCGETHSIHTNVLVTRTTTDLKDVISSNGYRLEVPTPNPTHNFSSISYTMPEFARVKITLVNELGSEVAVLQNSKVSEGTHNLSIDVDGLNLTSGVYSIVLKSSGVMLTQRLIVVK